MQKDVNRFIVPQVVPEIYRKNERLKNRGMCFFVIECIKMRAPSMLGMTFETIADFNYREGLGLDTLITEAMASWSE